MSEANPGESMNPKNIEQIQAGADVLNEVRLARDNIGATIRRVTAHDFDPTMHEHRKFWRDGYVAGLEAADNILREIMFNH